MRACPARGGASIVGACVYANARADDPSHDTERRRGDTGRAVDPRSEGSSPVRPQHPEPHLCVERAAAQLAPPPPPRSHPRPSAHGLLWQVCFACEALFRRSRGAPQGRSPQPAIVPAIVMVVVEEVVMMLVVVEVWMHRGWMHRRWMSIHSKKSTLPDRLIQLLWGLGRVGPSLLTPPWTQATRSTSGACAAARHTNTVRTVVGSTLRGLPSRTS